MISAWQTSIQDRRCPSRPVRPGMAARSTRGARKELHRVGQGRQAEDANHLQGQPGVPQPGRQGVEDQQVGQARGEAQGQHHRGAALQVDGQGLEGRRSWPACRPATSVLAHGSARTSRSVDAARPSDCPAPPAPVQPSRGRFRPSGRRAGLRRSLQPRATRGEGAPQRVRRQRLDQELVHAGGQAGLPVILEGVRRQGDDGGRSRPEATHFPRGLQPRPSPACACPSGSGRSVRHGHGGQRLGARRRRGRPGSFPGSAWLLPAGQQYVTERSANIASTYCCWLVMDGVLLSHVRIRLAWSEYADEVFERRACR
jgi:hypothetical protein